MLAPSLQITTWFYLSRLFGKWFGYLQYIPIPIFLRTIVFTIFSKLTNARPYEAVLPLHEFTNIFEFVTREVRTRPISDDSDIVSPVDGLVISVGKLIDYQWCIHQVKNINYPVEHILGLSAIELDQLQTLSDNLCFTTLYLPWGETHRFHSPVDWHITERLHIPGSMFNIDQRNIFSISSVFYNERVVLSGDWQHGKFWFVAVGSYSIGSIRLKFDNTLQTNYTAETMRTEEIDEVFKTLEFNGVSAIARWKALDVNLRKGEEFGFFESGSAFVLIFQYKDSEHIQFAVNPPQFAFCGSPLLM